MACRTNREILERVNNLMPTTRKSSSDKPWCETAEGGRQDEGVMTVGPLSPPLFCHYKVVDTRRRPCRFSTNEIFCNRLKVLVIGHFRIRTPQCLQQ